MFSDTKKTRFSLCKINMQIENTLECVQSIKIEYYEWRQCHFKKGQRNYLDILHPLQRNQVILFNNLSISNMKDNYLYSINRNENPESEKVRIKSKSFN